jgi:hypothetical protein
MDLQPMDTYSYHQRREHRHDVLERVVEAFGSFVFALLGFRFVLALLGANASNGFASFVNGFTSPFVSPFYNLFSYGHPSLGIATFEGYTLVAMSVYGLAAAGVAKLISITRYN